MEPRHNNDTDDAGRTTRPSHPVLFSAFCIAAAFGTYLCMYAFRKPFTAATFAEISFQGFQFKTILVTSQVFGYTLSKFIGIRVVSGINPKRRAAAIVGLIAFSELALLGFALCPVPYNAGFLFLNGLPLGMVFGLVLSFLEGRQLTEALSAGLCASFIVGSGIVKSVGRYLIEEWGVSEVWMPFTAGLVFLIPLLVCVALLQTISPPDPSDIDARSRRDPMTGEDRLRFLKKHAFAMLVLVGLYVALTIIRSVRDDFAVEIWQGLGGAKPAVFTQTETMICFFVVLINGAAIFIRDNRRAFQTSVALILCGFALSAAAVLAYQSAWLSGFWMMVLVGLGFYVPYVAYHTTVFERMIAVFRDKSNVVYLMYLADAIGYLAYVGIMLFRNYGRSSIDFLSFFLNSALLISAVSMLLAGVAMVYFAKRIQLS